MECPQCQQSYNDSESSHLPRILSFCGHSICSCCLKQLFINQQVDCPLCGKTSKADSIQMFTKNLALLQIINDNASSNFNKNISNLGNSSGHALSSSMGRSIKDFGNPPNVFDSISCYSQDSLGRNTEDNSLSNLNINTSPLCKQHFKAIEAFCWNEKMPLCIDCLLLSQAHKTHDVLNIQNSIDKQKVAYKQVALKVDCQSHKLKSNIKTLEGQYEDLDKTQLKQITDVKGFFQQAREILDKREASIVQGILEHSKTQSQQIDQKRTTLKDILNELSQLQNMPNEDSSLSTNSANTNLETLLNLLANETKATQVLKKIDTMNRSGKHATIDDFDRNKEIFSLNKQFQILKQSNTTPVSNPNHQKNSSYVNLNHLQQQQPLPLCSNPFRASQQPRDLSQKASSNKKVTGRDPNIDIQKAQKESKQRKDMSSTRKSYNNTQMKEMATPQNNNQRSNIIPMKQQTIKEKELKDDKNCKTRQSFCKPPENQNEAIQNNKGRATPSKIVSQKQIVKEYSHAKDAKGNQRCSSILQLTEFQDEQFESLNLSKDISFDLKQSLSSSNQQLKTKSRDNNSNYLNKHIPLKGMDSDLKSGKEDCQLRSKSNMALLLFPPQCDDPSEVPINDQASYNSTNTLVTQKQALPKTFKHLSSKTTSRFIVKKDEQNNNHHVQPFANTTNLEDQSATKVKNSSQIFKDNLRRPSLREMRNTAKFEKKMSNVCQQEEKEWAEKQQRKVESISLARQMSSRQSLNKLNNNDLESNDINDFQISLTQRLTDSDDQVVTLEQIKIDHPRLSKNKEEVVIKGVGIIGGIGDTYVSVDVYNPKENRWVGKYSVNNQKREGYKAINHPKNKQKIYLIGGKQNGKFSQKVLEYDIKSGKAFQADIKDLPHNFGEQYFACCSGIVKNDRKVLVASGSQLGQQVIITMYDFTDKKWSDLPKNGPQSLSDYQIMVQSNYLYVFGGHCDGVVSKQSHRYSFETSKWEKLPEMNEGRVYFGVVAIDADNIMVIGGYDGEKVLSNCEILNTEKGIWDKCSYINSKRINLNAINYEGQILIFGGVDDNDEIISQIESYDQVSKQWIIISPATLPSAINPESKNSQQPNGVIVPSQVSGASNQLTFGKRFCHSLVNVDYTL